MHTQCDTYRHNRHMKGVDDAERPNSPALNLRQHAHCYTEYVIVTTNFRHVRKRPVQC